MATPWDKHPPASLASLQDELVRRQVHDSIAPFSPFWQQRFGALGRRPDSIRGVADLATVPAAGERDVSPDGDPAAMSSLVLQAGEVGFTLHSPGPEVRRAMRLRLTRGDEYRRIVDADTRPTSYVFSGLGFRYPLASTRNDLDVVTRAGARLWGVLGLTSDDVLLSAVPPGATTEHRALEYAAIGAGAPAMFPGDDADDLTRAIRLAPPTAVAVPTATAPQILDGLSGLESVRTLILVGAPSDAERAAAALAFFRAGGPSDAAILAVHAPTGARVLWGECRASGGSTGFHTYPDLEVVQTVDVDTGEAVTADGELVLTQLGMRGSALLRWRTGDVVTQITADQCPACDRMVPRVEGVQRAALVLRLDSGRVLDLRSLSGVLTRRSDIRDWRLVLAPRRRDGALATVVHFEAIDPDAASTVIGVATDVRQVTGSLPTQLVAATHQELTALGGNPVSARILLG